MSASVQYRFIRIGLQGTSPSGKTCRYTVRNRKNGDLLGMITWHAAWRQYTFSPEPDTVYSAGCLSDIYQFVDACSVCHKYPNRMDLIPMALGTP